MEHSEAFAAEVRAALARVLESPNFSDRERLRRMLAYLVDETLAGRGDRLKGYAIGTEVLGRPASFEASGDAIVRVEVNRLRDALARYYAADGATEALRLSIPKGRYRVDFETAPQPAEAPAETGAALPEAPPRTRFDPRPGVALAASGLLVAILAVAGYLFSPPAETTGPPLIDVAPFTSDIADPELAHLAPGLRGQLIRELSHFRTLRVRAEELLSPIRSDLPPPDFRIAGKVGLAGPDLQIEIAVADVAQGTVLWSTQETFPAGAPAQLVNFQPDIRRITAAIGGPGGLVATEALRRAGEAGQDGKGPTAYHCLLFWYAYDTTKSPAYEDRARTCLTELTSADIGDGQIWAAYAFMTFLDWTRTSTDTGNPKVQAALTAAQRAIQLAPTASESYESLGSILLATGDHSGALTAYDNAARLNPSKPDIRVLFGWSEVLVGEWGKGIGEIEAVIEESPVVPGWFRIPVAVDLFRRQQYAASLHEAKLIEGSGDRRGLILALAAAKADEQREAAEFYAGRLAELGLDPVKALDEVRAVLNAPEVLDGYEAALRRNLTQ